MTRQEFEREFEEWRATIKVVDDPSFFIQHDDPVVLRKAEEATKSLLETPPPEWVLKRMRGEQ